MKAEIRKRIEKEQYEASEFKNLSYRTFDLKYNNKAWRLVQIPAYFVISSYRGGFYFEAVNGATGEVFGDFPVCSVVRFLLKRGFNRCLSESLSTIFDSQSLLISVPTDSQRTTILCS